MERFHDYCGVQPTAQDLMAFARGNGIPYPDPRLPAFGEWTERTAPGQTLSRSNNPK